MKTWLIIVVSLLTGLLASGLILLVTASPRGEAVQLKPPSSFSPERNDYANQVFGPGLDDQFSIRTTTDTSEPNNADVYQKDSGQPSSPNSSDLPAKNELVVKFPINLNIATSRELEALPGIGIVKAKGIVSYRQTFGPFLTIEDIQLVPGIGPGIFESIKTLITIGDIPY